MTNEEVHTRSTLLMLMCHPKRSPKIAIPEGDGYKVFLNQLPGYASGYKEGIKMAMAAEQDLVIADTDGYHPADEIVKLARAPMPTGVPSILKPYRTNIGVQSKVFSWFFSAVGGSRVKDATGGMYKMNLEFLKAMKPLKSNDMTIHIEILQQAARMGALVTQYGYNAALNDRKNSKRTKGYQLKLLRQMAKRGVGK
jgi:hypothetical protein